MPEPSFAVGQRLTSEETPLLYRQSLAAGRRGELPERLDLGQIQSTDSSALALLLEWQSWARARGLSIRFDNPPDSLRMLARLSEVDQLLGWSESEPG